MNVEELESIIRAELRRDASAAPSGSVVRAAVLDAVTGMPPDDRPVRRWAVPLLVAAAVVALAVAATVLPRAFGGHSQPAHPKPTPAPSLPAAPAPVGVICAHGQRLVSGVGARFTDAAGKVGYAYDYYCAGPDGSRTGSEVEWFRMVDGRLAFQAPRLTFAATNLYVMSLTGTDGGLLIREYDASPGINGHPGGVISDVRVQVDAAASSFGAGDLVAQPCLAADLGVNEAFAAEPTPHYLLRLTNRSGKPCAVWGIPRYRQTAVPQQLTVRPVLRGPAGGLTDEPSVPPLLLQPGQTASSAIGSDYPIGSCRKSALTAALPNGVQLGRVSISTCDLVSYPLVRAPNG